MSITCLYGDAEGRLLDLLEHFEKIDTAADAVGRFRAVERIDESEPSSRAMQMFRLGYVLASPFGEIDDLFDRSVHEEQLTELLLSLPAVHKEAVDAFALLPIRPLNSQPITIELGLTWANLLDLKTHPLDAPSHSDLLIKCCGRLLTFSNLARQRSCSDWDKLLLARLGAVLPGDLHSRACEFFRTAIPMELRSAVILASEMGVDNQVNRGAVHASDASGSNDAVEDQWTGYKSPEEWRNWLTSKSRPSSATAWRKFKEHHGGEDHPVSRARLVRFPIEDLKRGGLIYP